MKTLFLLLASCFLISETLQAQQSDYVSDETATWAYCEIVGINKFMSKKVTVVIDHGQESSNWFQDNRIVDTSTGQVKSFNSMVDAMNFMGALGWEFVQAYVVTISDQNVYHWLLKLPVKKDETGKYIPVTRAAAKKANGKQ